jgi:putative transcription antitermination factor YqgF
MQRFLGIDYGEIHIGLAFADSSLAQPLETIQRHLALDQIQHLIHKLRIQALVVGISEHHMAQHTQRFAQQLHHLTHLPIYYQDETLSSYTTRVKIAQARAKKSRRQQKIDHLVAAQILQDFLDEYDLANLPKPATIEKIVG